MKNKYYDDEDFQGLETKAANKTRTQLTWGVEAVEAAIEQGNRASIDSSLASLFKSINSIEKGAGEDIALYGPINNGESSQAAYDKKVQVNSGGEEDFELQSIANTYYSAKGRQSVLPEFKQKLAELGQKAKLKEQNFKEEPKTLSKTIKDAWNDFKKDLALTKEALNLDSESKKQGPSLPLPFKKSESVEKSQQRPRSNASTIKPTGLKS